MLKLLILCLILFGTFVSFAQDCPDPPALNQEIVLLARAKIKKKVGRGECWDLAEYVLDAKGCEWDHQYVYGRPIDPLKECIFPGDILQFEKVELKWQDGRTRYEESMSHHTAIVSKVIDATHIMILHQNTDEFGKKVGESDFYFNRVVKGKIRVYRPVQP